MTGGKDLPVAALAAAAFLQSWHGAGLDHLEEASMARKATASDVLIEAIVDWGVDVIFGIPGDGINGIMEALRTHQSRVRFIQVRHEEAAAFMACAYAKYTGKLGCCLATSGPGGIHLLNGLYDAKLDGQPVLAITGLQYHDLIGTNTQQDVELDKLFVDVAVFNQRVMGPAHVENLVDLACRTALSRRGVAHLTIPVDLQSAPATRAGALHSRRNILGHTSDVYFHGLHVPDAKGLEHAAEILNKGRKVAILCGRGAIHAAAELIEVAEKLKAPIVKALLGKAAVPDDHPHVMGGIGLLGTEPSEVAMEECDTLLMVGTSFPYLPFLPTPGQARCVQIDLDPSRIGLRYPTELGLVGDSRITLRALLPLLESKSDDRLLRRLSQLKSRWDEVMRQRGTNHEKPLKPQVVAWELGKRLKDDAIVSTDSGSITTWWARQIYARPGQMYSCSGTLATMACGLPYTIAAQIAFPERQCVGFVGDGGFSMLMAEFVTAVKYKLPIKIVVIKNNLLAQIKWEQIVMLGNPEFGCELAPIDFALFAKACGGEGYHIDDPSHCGSILEEALANDRACVIQAEVDPFEAPLPAKIKAGQALRFAKSMARGQPHAGEIIRSVIKEKTRELT